MKRILFVLSIALLVSCLYSMNVFAAVKVERQAWDKSSTTSCTKAQEQAKMAVNSTCTDHGGIKGLAGMGECDTKDVSDEWGGKPQFRSTVIYHVTCWE